MKTLDYLWSHIVALCFSSFFLGFFGGVGTVFVLFVTPVDETSTPREWIQATAGWAAAAVGTLTLVIMINQTRLSIKLVRHATGDLPPECYRREPVHTQKQDHKGSHFFSTINRNRRTLVVTKMEFLRVPSTVSIQMAGTLIRQERIGTTHSVSFLADSFRVMPAHPFGEKQGDNAKTFEITATQNEKPFNGQLPLRLHYYFGGDKHHAMKSEYIIYFETDI